MRLPFFSQARQFLIQPIEAARSEALSLIHAEGFSRPWAAGEFETLIEQDTVFGFVAQEVGRKGAAPSGFVLARLAAGEAEILTIAVARSCRRLGLGRALMDAVLRHLHSERAEALFLEVDETNAPAVTLYRRLGFREVGRREGYYGERGATKSSALVMRRDLR